MYPLCWKVDWILTEEGQLPKIKNEFWKKAKGKVVFIAGKILLPVPVGCRYQIMRVLHRRSVGSTDRAHNVVVLKKKDIDISSLEFEATSSRTINRSMGVRVGGKDSDIGTLTLVHDRVC